MNNGSSTYKGILLLLVFIFLWLPQLQNKFQFFELKKLEGDIYYPKEDSLNSKTWFSGQYQELQETYLNSAFGLRNFCVRLNNQIAYSVFNKAKANQVIIGKEDYLYEKYYIDTYMGEDFLGNDSINQTIKKLKFVSDTLKKLNKNLLLVFAAGKASYYPEFIPDWYQKVNENTNYKAFSNLAKETGIDVIDFNRWFMDNKTKSKYPLYPKYGIHWSKYGSVMVIDSIIRKIENLRKIDMAALYYDSLTVEQPHGIDYDIGGAMNLLFRLESFDMAYIKPKFEKDTTKVKPRLLTIADSFYWEIYGFGLSNVFENEKFWYYNSMVYPESFKEETLTDYLSFGNEINSHDVFMIMATEANLKKVGWGFIENAYNYFTKPELEHSENYFRRLKQLVSYIQTDPKWMRDINERAQKENQIIKLQVVKEAKWVLQNEGVY